MADQALADRDKDFWSTRVRALSSLAAADALAVVLPLPDGRYVSFAEHNVGHDPAWLEGAAQYLVWSAVKQRTVQRRAETQIALDDGRTANSIVVAPIPWSDRIIGALVALRVAATYEPTVGASTGELAQLVGLELAVSSVLQRSAIDQRPDDAELRRALDDRRHAIALYEVSRLALRADGPTKTAAVVADALGYGLVGIWLDEDGWLRLEDGHGYSGEPARVRIEGDATLQRIVRDGVTQRVPRDQNGGAPWMGTASEVIAAPLSTSGADRGMLVLGQPARPFTSADLTLAPTLAECVGLARAHRALPPAAPRAELPLSDVLAPLDPEDRSVDVAGAYEPRLPPPPKMLEATTPAAARPTSSETPAASAEGASGARTRRKWVVPLFALAVIAAAVGTFLGEPLLFVLAGLLLLVALWGWLA